MLTRLKSWIQGSRQRKLERWEADNLSKEHKPGLAAGDIEEQFLYETKGFDESSRGRPRK